MSAGTASEDSHAPEMVGASPAREPSAREVVGALAITLLLVLLTRLPVARPAPYDLDERGYLDFIAAYHLPPTHTLFLASGRVLGAWLGDAYRGFLLLDMIVSGLALTAVWWWLRSLVRPSTAALATLALGLSPIVWSYGAMAANYTAILLVGSILLGIAWQSRSGPKSWHPYAAAVVLALGAGYRQDIGTLWLPLFGVILWRYRWTHAIPAAALFVAVNLAWFVPMLHDVGGWHVYRAINREFAHKAGYLNSFWNLGWIDGPVRYAAKLAIALALILGPGLIFTPRGLARVRRIDGGAYLALLLALSIVPALGLHLMIHFGVPGYGFHYVPALMALVVIGIGRSPLTSGEVRGRDLAPARLAVLGGMLGAFFLLYPTDFHRGGIRGDFDLAFARYTRTGLQTEPPLRVPSSWRTTNSEVLPGAVRTERPRQSITEVVASFWTRNRGEEAIASPRPSPRL